MEQKLIFSNNLPQSLHNVITGKKYNKIFIITDDNTFQFALPKLGNGFVDEYDAKCISFAPGDVNKNISSLQHVWQQLSDNGATRNSLIINLGGGVVTDLGGFAAASFKRGVDFVNIPTTLLSAVDAAVGGKTGINFNGLKNEIGTFREADAVIISTIFYDTLPLSELKSGYAEMIKHALLNDADSLNRLLSFDISSPDPDSLLQLLAESVEVKRKIVLEDPFEKGLRRALNLGHTAGHAFESMAMHRNSPIPHGYAVAWGLVVELVLSHMKLSFDSIMLHRIAEYVRNIYGTFHITCDDYDAIVNYMRHDKKSRAGELNFSLMESAGNVKIDCEVLPDDVKAALDIYRDFMHI